MARQILVYLFSAVLSFSLFFLVYRYGEDRSIASSIKIASLFAIINTGIFYLSFLNWHSKDFQKYEDEKLQQVIDELGVELKKDNKGIQKYRLINKKWPLNVLRVQKTNFIIYVSGNYKTVKKLENEVKGKTTS